MSKQTISVSHALCVLCAMAGLFAGCAASHPAAADPEHPTSPLNEWTDWKKWEYPNNVGRTVTDNDAAQTVLYQASTGDSFRKVVEHYESTSGIKGMADSQSAGAWVGDSVEGRERVHAKQTVADFGHYPVDRLPNECTFLINMPGYSVTAFIRQEPPTGNTRITLVFGKKTKAE